MDRQTKNKTVKVIIFCAASSVLCGLAQGEVPTKDAATAKNFDLSSLATPQTFTFELRDIYLTRAIDEMSSGKSETSRIGGSTSFKRTTSGTMSALMGLSSTESIQERHENRRNSQAGFNASARGQLKWGVFPSASFSAGGDYANRKENETAHIEENNDILKADETVSFGETQEQTDAEQTETTSEGAEETRIGKYHLCFSVVFRNHDPNDTLHFDGGRMRARLGGPGLTGTISAPYQERGEFSLGLGETICSFDCEINDERQLSDLLRLRDEGGLELLKLEASGADIPIVSEKTGKNVIDERNAMARRRPSTEFSIEFGELEKLSPWMVSRLHTAGSGTKGSPVTLKEALMAIGEEANKRSDVLPDNVFVFSESGLLEKVVNRQLLGKGKDGQYRMFAVRFTEADGTTKLHLPLPSVLEDKIEEYSQISLFPFDFDEFARMAVLHPVYFTAILEELQGWLAKSGVPDAAKVFAKLFEERQKEDDVREYTLDDWRALTKDDAERFRLRAEAGVPEMQGKYAVCLIGGWGVESNHVEAIKWLRRSAEQGYCEAEVALGALHQIGACVEQNDRKAFEWYHKAADHGYDFGLCLLGDCYRDGIGMETNHVEAVKYYRKAAEKGVDEAQSILGDCYLNGIGVESNQVVAVEWYRKAAEQMNVDAQRSLGNCYLFGFGVTQDDDKAMEWFLKAANQGDADTQFILGSISFIKMDYSGAVKWYRKAAEQGDAEAQCALGECYLNGIGVESNNVEAVEWYRKAAIQGNAEAQSNLGRCYMDGVGVETNHVEAIKWYRKAAEQGDLDAQIFMGDCYLDAENNSEAFKWYQKAAEQGHAGAQFAVAKCYFNGRGVEQDYKEAIKWAYMAAEQGEDDAQCSLGFCYANGIGVVQDSAEAMKWARLAAEQDNAMAQNNLGYYYSMGIGVATNATEAVKWYRKAAEQGVADAQWALAGCYANGNGVKKDENRALYWARKAAEQGLAQAQVVLADCYANGDGVKKDEEKAVFWMRKAAEQGCAEAQCLLGIYYHDGFGVKQDLYEAKKWLRMAAEQGDEEAQSLLDDE